MSMIPYARVSSTAYKPTVNREHDAGIDFYCRSDISIGALNQKIVLTGVTVEIPQGYVGLLKPKGAHQRLVGSGVVEWTYQGEIMFRIFNATNEELIITRGQPVGQMIIVANLEPMLQEVDPDIIHMTKTERGATGGIVQASLEQS